MANIEYTRLNGADPRSAREFVQFSEDARHNPGKSEAAGRAIFDPVEMVSISFPGNNLTEVVREATDSDRQRWPDQYAVFKRTGGTAVVGTPLSAWTSMTKAMVRELNALNIFTVDQLANINDLAIQRIGMGGRMWRERAQAFLAAAEDNALVDGVVAENGRLKERVDTQAQQIAELGAMCTQLQAQITGVQNANASIGRPMVPFVADPQTVSPALAGGALGGGDDYVAPVRNKGGRPRKTEVA